jgi:hypothetical protein
MIKWLIRRKLEAFERQHGYDASYMHEVLDIDASAFLKFGRATGLASYRKDVPADVYCGASLTSSVQADCGPCTQLGVGLALQAGVSPQTIAAIIKGDDAAMPPDVALAARFARAVLARDPAVDEYREQIQRRWGDRAVLALAFGIMATQLYPTLKYAMGYGKACTRVVVAGQTVAPRRPALAGAALG